MYEKTGMKPPRWTWEEEVSILDRILEIKPDDEIAILMRDRMLREKRTHSELGADFWNEEISPKYHWDRLSLEQVLPECGEWKRRHKSAREKVAAQ
jgi:hypothetical protein